MIAKGRGGPIRLCGWLAGARSGTLGNGAGAAGAMPIDGRRRFELRAQTFGGGAGAIAFELHMQLGGNLQELAVAGLPDLEKRPRIEAPFHGTALVEAFFEGLTDEILFQAFAAGILQNAGKPEQLLTVEPGKGILRVGHGASAE